MDGSPDSQAQETFVQAKVDMIGRLLTDVASGSDDVIREVLQHGGQAISDEDVARARYLLPWKSYWDLRELNTSAPDLVSQEMVDTTWKICAAVYGQENCEASAREVLSGLSEGLSLDEAAERALPQPLSEG